MWAFDDVMAYLNDPGRAMQENQDIEHIAELMCDPKRVKDMRSWSLRRKDVDYGQNDDFQHSSHACNIVRDVTTTILLQTVK